MTPTMIDQGGSATIASAEGQAALAAGDTQLAHEKHAQAGAILEQEAAQEQTAEGQQLALFLAATQYYKGGRYQKALSVALKVKMGLLPENMASLMDGFLQNAKERAASDYQSRVAERLRSQLVARDYAGILETLKDHPYVLNRAELAYNRAVCCENLGKYRPAVLFFADAARWAPDDPHILSAMASLPLILPGQEKLQEAWRYSQAQLELFPNAVSYAVASLLCYRRGHQSEGANRTGIFRDQVQYFEQAREAYLHMPPTHQGHPEIKAVMGLGYEAAALALYQFGDDNAAREMSNAAIVLDPTSPKGWTLFGVIASAGPEAERAFRKAVELGDRTYFPFYYLAHGALQRKEYQEALEWARQALGKGERQDSEVKSLLYQWSAISLMHLGAAREEIDSLFRKAVEAAPDSDLARENYQRFQDNQSPTAPPPAPRRIPFPWIDVPTEKMLTPIAG